MLARLFYEEANCTTSFRSGNMEEAHSPAMTRSKFIRVAATLMDERGRTNIGIDNALDIVIDAVSKLIEAKEYDEDDFIYLGVMQVLEQLKEKQG